MIENSAGQPVDVEVKASATVKERDLSGLKKLASLAGDQFIPGVLLYDGDETMPLGSNRLAPPLSTLWGSQSRHQHANLAERHKYHDSTHPPLMAVLLFVLQRAGNAMKNTIDDADYIINLIVFIFNKSIAYKFLSLPLDCK